MDFSSRGAARHPQSAGALARFPDEYWRERDRTAEFPWEFYQAIADAGWLGITIPRSTAEPACITEASLVRRRVAESGGGTRGLLVDPSRHLRPRVAAQIRHRIRQGSTCRRS
jgi:alkylation response protein AidB-like acyl-CoA dehydrogenase